MMNNNMNSPEQRSTNKLEYDVLVIGGGIAGQEASLNLANNGFKVLLVEKDLSIGGKMIHLSEVFPTLDCSACIATPKISETARNPNITIKTYSEVEDIKRDGNGLKAIVIEKPRYVKADLCTGCPICEEKCPVVVEDEYNFRMRKAIKASLKEGPKTIPQLVEEMKLPTDVVTYYVMSLRKFGDIAVGDLDENDEYYSYELLKK